MLILMTIGWLYDLLIGDVYVGIISLALRTNKVKKSLRNLKIYFVKS